MLKARFYRAATNTMMTEVPVGTATFSFEEDTTNKFTFALPLTENIYSLLNSKYYVRFYFKGIFIMEGFMDTPSIKVSEGRTSVSISGSAELIELSKVRSNSGGVYQDSTVLGIIMHLLQQDVSERWTIGDFSTVPNYDIVTTLDLRTEKHLLPQLVNALSSTPNMHYRYGGVSPFNGLRRIDVGSFGTETDVLLTQGTTYGGNIGLVADTINIKEDVSDNILFVECYGGTIKDPITTLDRRITLQDALDADPTLATDPEFPIITINGKLVVKQKLMENETTLSITETFDNIKPTQETIVAADIENAGLALWAQAKAYLTKVNERSATYTVDVLGLDIENVPAVGDKVYFKAAVMAHYIHPITDRSIIWKPIDIDEYFRASSITIKIDNTQVQYQFRLTDGGAIPPDIDIVSMYDLMDPGKEEKTPQDPSLADSEVVEFTVGPGISADCFAGGMPGKLFYAASPATPVGYNRTIAPSDVAIVTPGGSCDISNYPPIGPLTLCLHVNDTWDTSSQITFKVLFFHDST
jgi:hypothetical protein